MIPLHIKKGLTYTRRHLSGGKMVTQHYKVSGSGLKLATIYHNRNSIERYRGSGLLSWVANNVAKPVLHAGIDYGINKVVGSGASNSILSSLASQRKRRRKDGGGLLDFLF